MLNEAKDLLSVAPSTKLSSYAVEEPAPSGAEGTPIHPKLRRGRKAFSPRSRLHAPYE
jgi:hypothetical protein